MTKEKWKAITRALEDNMLTELCAITELKYTAENWTQRSAILKAYTAGMDAVTECYLMEQELKGEKKDE